MNKWLLIIILIFIACSTSWSQTIPSNFPVAFQNAKLNIEDSINLDSLINMSGETIESIVKGSKTIVYNIWFVGCRGCKQEEPFLRTLTTNYINNSDVRFISLCMSQKNKISKYLEKNGDFGYEIIPTDRKYVNNNLGVQLSPTHIIVQDGIILEYFSLPISNEVLRKWFENRINNINEQYNN